MMLVLIKFIACSAILLLLFNLFLAKEKTFQLNRWILLFLIPSAILIPFLSYSIILPQESPIPLNYLPVDQVPPISEIPSAKSSQGNSTLNWVLLVYLPVFFLLLFKKLRALNRLMVWTKIATPKPILGAYLILSEKVLSPFSFGKYIFMNPSDYGEGTEKTDLIIKHECVHISQRHHIDLAVMEFLTVVCWFNPVVYLVRKAMVLNHEYQADQLAKNFINPIQYKKLLLKLSVRNTSNVWTSPISSSALKLRLIMMNKPTMRRTMNRRTLFFGLFASMMIAGFSLKINAQQTVPDPSQSQKQLPLEWDQYVPVEEQPEYEGGMAAFYSYVTSELNYPMQARKQGIEGQVEVQFVVEKDGSLSNVTAINGIGSGCDAEAVRVVKNAPAFRPGKQRGKPVRVQMVLPILFNLNKTKPDHDNLPTGDFIVEEVDQRNGELKVDASYANGAWSGTVRDPEGNELPGANIVVVDSSSGTVTDLYGRFSIETSPSETLNISFVGYKSARLEGN
jgi:TonB family protein